MQHALRFVSLIFLLLVGVNAPARSSFDAGIAQVQQYGNPQARAVILVPGLACGPWVWDRQIRDLSKRYAVYVLTLPGFGGRKMVAGGHLMNRAVDSIHELIVRKHLRRPILVGHSLGGTISVMFGETYPNDVTNIVSAEGGYPEGATQKARDAAVAREVAPYEHVTQAQMPRALHDNMLQYTITKRSDVDRATVLAGRSEPAAVVAWMKAALTLDLTPGLSRITVPFTEIIPFDKTIDPYVGPKTAAAKLDMYHRWVNHAKHGTVVMIQPSRHFVMIDRPAAFEKALESAIAR